MNRADSPIRGKRVLVVEDEYLLANDLEDLLASVGATVVGPAASCQRALAYVVDCGGLDGAVLDINLRGDQVFPVADALRARCVPFIFASGYDQLVVPDTYADVPRLQKPIDPKLLIEALTAQLSSVPAQAISTAGSG